MKVKVKDVKANPYRNIDHYPLNKDKIMALTTSIEATGFWDNLVGREVDGEVQIAYGHHRIEALRLAKGYGYDFEFDLPIRDISDKRMIKIMANENMQEWSHSVVVTDETVKVVKEFLEGEMFVPEKTSKYNYKDTISAKDIANFLGWNESKVSKSLRRLNAIDKGTIDKKAISDMPTETHAVEFVKAIEKSKVEFTPKEQQRIVREISYIGMGKRDVKGFVELRASEKKHPRGKKEEKKKPKDPRVKKFEDHLFYMPDKIDPITKEIKLLTEMHNVIKNIPNVGTSYRKVRLLFISLGKLQRSLNKFFETMAKEEELTEEAKTELNKLLTIKNN